MAERRSNIDELFRKGLSEYEHIPPPEIWKNIDARLEGKKKAKAALIKHILRIAAVILLLLGFGGGLMHIFRQDTTTKNYLSPDKMVKSPDTESVPAPDHPPLHITGTDRVALAESTEDISPARSADKEKEEAIPPVYETVKAAEKDFRLPSRLIPIYPQPLTVPESDPIPGFTPETKSPMVAYSSAPRISFQERGRWSAGIIFTPAYSFRSLSAGEAGQANKTHFNFIESGNIYFSGGFNISYQINDRLAFQSGLDLVRMGQSIGGLQIFDNPSVVELIRGTQTHGRSLQPVSNSLGTIYSGGLPLLITDNYDRVFIDFETITSTPLRIVKTQKTGKIIQSLYYVHLPVVFRYYLINNDIDLLVTGGFGANILAGNKVFLKYLDENLNIGKTLDLNSFGLSGTLGLGFEYSLDNNIVFSLEPRIIHFLTPVNPGGLHPYRPYSFSFYSGISYRF